MEASPDHVELPPDDQMTVDDSHQRSVKKFKSTKRFFADTVSSHATINVEEPSREAANEWSFEDPDIELDSEMEVTEKNGVLCQEWKMAKSDYLESPSTRIMSRKEDGLDHQVSGEKR